MDAKAHIVSLIIVTSLNHPIEASSITQSRVKFIKINYLNEYSQK